MYKLSKCLVKNGVVVFMLFTNKTYGLNTITVVGRLYVKVLLRGVTGKDLVKENYCFSDQGE